MGLESPEAAEDLAPGLGRLLAAATSEPLANYQELLLHQANTSADKGRFGAMSWKAKIQKAYGGSNNTSPASRVAAQVAAICPAVTRAQPPIVFVEVILAISDTHNYWAALASIFPTDMCRNFSLEELHSISLVDCELRESIAGSSAENATDAMLLFMAGAWDWPDNHPAVPDAKGILIELHSIASVAFSAPS